MTDSMTVPEALEVLQLPPGASRAEVKQAYRAMISACHPDLAADPSDAEERATKATRVNIGHALLSRSGTWAGNPSQTHTRPSTRTEPPAREKPPRHRLIGSLRRTQRLNGRRPAWTTSGAATRSRGSTIRP